jgi:hypothetical protein
MRKTEEDRKAEIINALAAARQSIFTAVECVPPWQDEQPCIGRWCIKDLLAHLIGWDHTNLEAVQQILAGERPRFFLSFDTDWHTYNDLLVSLYRKDSLSALRADAGESHQRLVAFLRSLTASQVLTGRSSPENGRPVSIRSLLLAETKDELEHAEQVRIFFEKDCAL